MPTTTRWHLSPWRSSANFLVASHRATNGLARARFWRSTSPCKSSPSLTRSPLPLTATALQLAAAVTPGFISMFFTITWASSPRARRRKLECWSCVGHSCSLFQTIVIQVPFNGASPPAPKAPLLSPGKRRLCNCLLTCPRSPPATSAPRSRQLAPADHALLPLHASACESCPPWQ